MRNETRTSTGNLCTLEYWERPEAASFSLECEPGYDKIFWQHRAIGGKYDLPRPLERMTEGEIEKMFGSGRLAVSFENIRELWEQTQASLSLWSRLAKVFR